MKDDQHDNPGVECAGAKQAPKRPFAQLLAYLFEWRRREADRTIGRYAYLIGQPVDFYRVHEADIARSAALPEADRTVTLPPAAILKDCA